MNKKYLLLFCLLSLMACQQTTPLLSPTNEDVYPQSLEMVIALAADDSRSLPLLQNIWSANVLDQRLGKKKHWYLITLSSEQLSAQKGKIQSSEQALIELTQNIRQALGASLLSMAPNLPVEKAQNFRDLNLGRPSSVAGWWQRETGVERAWDYSLGTGVQAAYLDLGFSAEHPEYASRLIINGRNNQTLEYKGKSPNRIDLPQGDHGTASLLVGFAERENGIPSAGVAPNALIAPYVASDVWEAAGALEAALESGAEVIGMNFAFSVFPRWHAETDFQQYQVLRDVVERLSDYPQSILVVPAHNFGEPVSGGPREWIPVAWSEDHPQIMGVGGAQINGDNQTSVWINPALLTAINARGSNYADYLIWAPSVFLDTASTHPNGIVPNIMSGTSASCPFITGSIALLKSRFPKLAGAEIKQILQQSARQISAEALTQRPGHQVPFVQVDQALRTVIQEKGLNPDQFRARHWQGILKRSPDRQYWLQTNKEEIPLMPTLEALRPDILHPDLNQEVVLSGWRHLPGLPANEIEVKQLRRIKND